MNPLLLAFYGDDFTGSTDCLEMLERGGVAGVLFLRSPSPADLARFPGIRAVGLAGDSRTLSPSAMAKELPGAFTALGGLGAPIVHYKVCSTFDSSPEIGSIGKAIEIGREVFGSEAVSLYIPAPALGRHVVFGNLFARSGLDSDPVRLDRHPTMSCHPVTPMDESDVRLLLARQTTLPCGLIDILTIGLGLTAVTERIDQLESEGAAIVLFDGLDASHLAISGDALRRGLDPQRPRFMVGSSGVEMALVASWQAEGITVAKVLPRANPVTQIIAVSGSCSPVTARQIRAAEKQGFTAIALESRSLLDASTAAAAIGAGIAAGLAALVRGLSPILHTALGSDDPRIAALTGHPETGKILGEALAAILAGMLGQTDVRRIVVAGGDTSTFVARALGITALQMLAPIAPGGPLCRASSDDPLIAQLEIQFKGGQVGRDSVFLDVRAGGPALP